VFIPEATGSRGKHIQPIIPDNKKIKCVLKHFQIRGVLLSLAPVGLYSFELRPRLLSLTFTKTAQCHAEMNMWRHEHVICVWSYFGTLQMHIIMLKCCFQHVGSSMSKPTWNSTCGNQYVGNNVCANLLASCVHMLRTWYYRVNTRLRSHVGFTILLTRWKQHDCAKIAYVHRMRIFRVILFTRPVDPHMVKVILHTCMVKGGDGGGGKLPPGVSQPPKTWE